MISGRPLVGFADGELPDGSGLATGATGVSGTFGVPPKPGAMTILVGFLRAGEIFSRFASVSLFSWG